MRSFPTIDSSDRHALSAPTWILMTTVLALVFALIPRAVAM